MNLDVLVELLESEPADVPELDMSFVDALERRLMELDLDVAEPVASDAPVSIAGRRARRWSAATIATVTVAFVGAAAAAGVVIVSHSAPDRDHVRPAPRPTTAVVPTTEVLPGTVPVTAASTVPPPMTAATTVPAPSTTRATVAPATTPAATSTEVPTTVPVPTSSAATFPPVTVRATVPPPPTAPVTVPATNAPPTASTVAPTTAPPVVPAATEPATTATAPPTTAPPTTAATSVATTSTEVHVPATITLGCAGDAGGITCTWGALPVGAARVAVLRSDGRAFTVVLPERSYTDALAEPGSTYSYLIHALDAGGNDLGHSNASSATRPA